MGVNANVYGNVSDWNYYYNGQAEEPNDSVYCLSNTNWIVNNPNTPRGLPIDKSLACSGLGYESCWSHLKFYDAVSLAELGADGGGIADADIIENRAVTNWCFSESAEPYQQSAYNSQFAVVPDCLEIATNTNTYPDQCRYSPTPYEDYRNGRWNPSIIRPITQFNHKNLIACLYVHAVDGDGYTIDTDLYTYCLTHSARYNTILAVYFQLFIDYGQTQRRPIGVFADTHNTLTVSILDNIQLPVTNPYMYNLVSWESGNKIKLMGSICRDFNFDTKASTESDKKTYIGMCAPDTWVLNVTGGRTEHYEYAYTSWGTIYREYDETFHDECFKEIACFGILFTDKESTALNDFDIDSDDIYCGVLDENLIGHGTWTSGEHNADNAQLNWTNSNDSTYNPAFVPEVDTNIYGTSDSFNPVSLADGTLKRYVLDDAGMELLNKYLWDVIDTTDPDALIQNQTLTNFLTNNPLDCVVNIKRFPFSDMSQGAVTNIRLGKVTVPNTSAKPFDADSVTKSCGSVRIPDFFGDWRNYICKYTLVLPFCGSIDLPAEIVTGRDVEVKYTIDYTTGTCTAFALITDDSSKYKNSGNGVIAIDSASGNCSVDIPVSGIQTATLNSEIYNANENLKASKFNNMVNAVHQTVSIAESASSGSKTRTFDSLLSLAQMGVNAVHSASVAEWNINNTEIPTKLIGASSGCNALQFNLTPRVICYVPVTDSAYNNDKYAHSVGFACCESNTLSAYSDGEGSRNYIEVSNLDLSGISATATEKDMIISALSGGVYI